MHVAQLPDSHENGGLQAGAPGGLEDGVARLVVERRASGDRAGSRATRWPMPPSSGGHVAGHHEPLDEHAGRRATPSVASPASTVSM